MFFPDLDAIDPRGTWALSGGSSALWNHGFMGDANGPNCNFILADDVNGCDASR